MGYIHFSLQHNLPLLPQLIISTSPGPDLYQNARNMHGTCSDLTDTLTRIYTTSLIKADFLSF